MSYSNLTLAVADGVATVTVNRPDKLNALNDATIVELGTMIDELRARDDVRGVILTGAGRAFIAGADISELAAQNPVGAMRRARRGQLIFSRFESSPKPVIAAVNGFALGGGCELAMACHVRIASDTAKFGQPEVKLGIVPGYGGTQRLPRLVGKGRALELLLTGEMITVATAMLRQMLANGPLAVALCLEAVHAGFDMPLDDALRLESTQFGVLASTADMREGMSAFLEKRAPRFAGQ